MTSLLPPNATAPERALEQAMRADVDLSAVGTLWDPATCPADVLPFLAWGLAISHWDAAWSETEKRGAIAQAIPFHKRKGTRGAVEEVLARFHPLLSIVEWFEANPRRTPRTFEVRAPAGPGGIDASFLSTPTAEAIIRDVAAAKPLGAHFDFVFALETKAALYMSGGLLGGSISRNDYTAVHDTSRDWSTVFQTEDGEPILTPEGADFLETA